MKPIGRSGSSRATSRAAETHAKLSELLAGRRPRRFERRGVRPGARHERHYDVDQARSIHLAECPRFAVAHLRRRRLRLKVFEASTSAVPHRGAALPLRVPVPPAASRSSSSEIYLVAKGFKGKPADDAEE